MRLTMVLWILLGGTLLSLAPSPATESRNRHLRVHEDRSDRVRVGGLADHGDQARAIRQRLARIRNGLAVGQHLTRIRDLRDVRQRSIRVRNSRVNSQEPTRVRNGRANRRHAAPLGNGRATSEEPTRIRGGDGAAILLAAGDIASCDSRGDEATADLLDRFEGTVITLGDLAYESGSRSKFKRCYDQSWGRHKDRTRPAPGNHEYETNRASGYFNYFGSAAGDPDTGYYSYDLGNWHIVALNSNCAEIGGCDERSRQVRWLRADLRASNAVCTLAYWHHPLFTSGNNHGNTEEVRPLWETLYEHGADIVLSGHEHNYERFAPQDPTGDADPSRGIRQFIVGTGGASFYGFGSPEPNSEVRITDTPGILKLSLRAGSYTWRFVSVDSDAPGDRGIGDCH